jgi:hypothetical protein
VLRARMGSPEVWLALAKRCRLRERVFRNAAHNNPLDRRAGSWFVESLQLFERSLLIHVKLPKLFLLAVREVQDQCDSPTLRIRSGKRGSERRLSPNRRPNPDDPGAAL